MTAAMAESCAGISHNASDLEILFKGCFGESERTALMGGADEPLYEPAGSDGEMHVLYYREDFFASALHEIAHWCIAGEARRQLRDFGYWYAPEGRNPEEQQAFEAVEVGPQALEWVLSCAAGYRFRLSVDNLDPATGALPDTRAFAGAVLARVEHFQALGLPARGRLFFDCLRRHYGVREDFSDMLFSLEDISQP